VKLKIQLSLILPLLLSVARLKQVHLPEVNALLSTISYYGSKKNSVPKQSTRVAKHFHAFLLAKKL